MVTEGEVLWVPGEARAAASNLARYQRWLRDRRSIDTTAYDELWQWSVREPEQFWRSLWDYFDILHDGAAERAMDRQSMLGVRWFEGARVNYAEHLLRHEEVAPDRTVFHHACEGRDLAQMSWRELGTQVRKLATRLRALGVRPGDRVVSYLPNVPETAVAMMATTAIGAVWSSAAIEFGVKTVVDRFRQIGPKVLFAADGYRYGGVEHDRSESVRQIVSELDSLEHIIWVPQLQSQPATLERSMLWSQALDVADVPVSKFQYERVAHDHPLWVVFSSGTTGLPKAIVHSHVGMLLEHLKLAHFHIDLGPRSVMFFYTTTGWIMWNVLLSSLLAGAGVVLYDGNPAYPSPELLWRLAAECGATCFGASPTYVQIMQKHGVRPGATLDLARLETIVVSGAPCMPETFEWFYRNVKPDLWVTSQSGGTEIGSGFVGAAPTLPVRAGEIQARMLGMDVHAWNDDGEEVFDTVGELVVTRAFPSMPLYFWNDDDGQRYRQSYFEYFPGVWRHGDFLKIAAHGGCYIYGRSDATLNRFGVRIGSAEIYRVLETMEEVADSLVVCCELPGGKFFMPLFLKLRSLEALDDELRARIVARLRQDASPRHVPDAMYPVAAIPYTLTGKKMEIPVRNLLMGRTVEQVVNRDAMLNPEAMAWFIEFAAAAALEPARR